MNRPISARTARAIVGGTAALIILATTGCTSLLTPLGSENYDCNRKENPSSPYCHSFRSAADGTNTPLPDSRYDAAVKISEVDRLVGIAPDAVAPSSAAPVPRDLIPAPRQPASTAPAEGSPVRVAPLVQRTWVKRHLEQGDRLVGTTYLYKEVTRGHWQGFVEAPGGEDPARGPIKPHLALDDDTSGIRTASGAVSKGATGFVSRVKSSLSQPGLATPAGEVVAPPIDGASMPQ
jgi:conjugal transfer pilus assembly protein TraV